MIRLIEQCVRWMCVFVCVFEVGGVWAGVWVCSTPSGVQRLAEETCKQ